MNRLRFVKIIFLLLLLSVAYAACNDNDSTAVYQPVFTSDSSNQNTIIVGFPSFSYSQSMEPTIEYLNAHLQGTRIKVHACVSWEEFISLLDQRKFDLSIINGIVACRAASNGYSIRGKITSDDPNSGYIITRKDSHISEVKDLKGKKIALVPSNLIPITMMGKYYLYQKGLDVNVNIHTEKVASFEAAIISVYLGKSDAGICPVRNWNIYVRDHPEVMSKVEIKWETPAFEHNAILIKNTVDKGVATNLLNLLFSMHNKIDAKTALSKASINGFEKADSTVYKPMLDFKRKYDSVIF